MWLDIAVIWRCLSYHLSGCVSKSLSNSPVTLHLKYLNILLYIAVSIMISTSQLYLLITDLPIDLDIFARCVCCHLGQQPSSSSLAASCCLSLTQLLPLWRRRLRPAHVTARVATHRERPAYPALNPRSENCNGRALVTLIPGNRRFQHLFIYY